MKTKWNNNNAEKKPIKWKTCSMTRCSKTLISEKRFLALFFVRMRIYEMCVCMWTNDTTSHIYETGLLLLFNKSHFTPKILLYVKCSKNDSNWIFENFRLKSVLLFRFRIAIFKCFCCYIDICTLIEVYET